jgi:hypothetical protein
MKNAGSVSKHKKIIAFMVVWPALSLVCYGLESFPETTQIPHPALSQGEREKLSFPSPLGESPFGPGACSARYNRVPAAHATPEGADEGPEQLPFPSKLEIQPIVDLEAPTVPRGLEVRRTGRNAILDWDESIDHVTGVVGYRVYRDGLLIAEVERAPYVDKDVSAGTKRYQITGVDGAGNESALSTPTVSGDLQGPGPAAGEVYSYPNPAVGGAAPVIRAQLADTDRATVKIYDIFGQLVESGELRPVPSAGSGTPYEYAWTGPIASGTYFGVVESLQSGVPTHTRLKISVVR